MKLYHWQPAPNPRRVRIFLAEKSISVPMEDVGEGPRLRSDYRANYSFAMVPMLELDDGTQIGEAMAICRYFEDLHPDPPLMGVDARDKAVVDMWERRAWNEGMAGAAEVFRNTHAAFVDRGLPGFSEPVPQIPALVERGRRRVAHFFQVFDAQLAGRSYVAGERYSVADITTLCSIDFAKMAKIDIPRECTDLRRWYETVSARPSARA